MGLFMVWLRYSPSRLGAENPTVAWGPGTKPVRGERRVNGVLAAVRGLLLYAVSVGVARRSVLGQLYELADSRDLPEEAKGEETGLYYRLRARHRLQEPQAEVDRALDEELVGMFVACRSARDRLVVRRPPKCGHRSPGGECEVTSSPVLLFELGWREVVEGAMAPSGVVGGQPLENLQPRLTHRREHPLVHYLPLAPLPERLSEGIVVARADPAHAPAEAETVSDL